MRRRALTAASALAALGLVVISASPASAAELPATDDLFSLTQEALYSTTSTGASTLISALEQTNEGKYGADFDVTTGNAYYFANDTDPVCTLYSLNPTTGVSTLIGAVGDTGMDECDALNVDSDGVLRIADQDGVVITVDKSTGATISSVEITDAPAGNVSFFIGQASTGQFYVGSYVGGLYTFDPATGTTVFVAQVDDYLETASFDSADTLWYSGDGNDCQGLNSASLSDLVGTATPQGDFAAGIECLDVYAMFIVQPADIPAPPAPVDPAPVDPELAATGAAPTTAAGAIAALALMVGVGAVALARRERASAV